MKFFRLTLAVMFAAARLQHAPAPGFCLTPVQLSQLTCRDCGMEGVSTALISSLTALQKDWGTTLRFTSGLRCVKHNLEVGGVQRSDHLVGAACDAAVPPKRQKAFAAKAKACGFAVVLPNAKRGYVHLAVEL